MPLDFGFVSPEADVEVSFDEDEDGSKEIGIGAGVEVDLSLVGRAFGCPNTVFSVVIAATGMYGIL